MDNHTRQRMLGTAKSVLDQSSSQVDDMAARGAFAAANALVVIADILSEETKIGGAFNTIIDVKKLDELR